MQTNPGPVGSGSFTNCAANSGLAGDGARGQLSYDSLLPVGDVEAQCVTGGRELSAPASASGGVAECEALWMQCVVKEELCFGVRPEAASVTDVEKARSHQ
jgi:hypothetical protein